MNCNHYDIYMNMYKQQFKSIAFINNYSNLHTSKKHKIKLVESPSNSQTGNSYMKTFLGIIRRTLNKLV